MLQMFCSKLCIVRLFLALFRSCCPRSGSSEYVREITLFLPWRRKKRQCKKTLRGRGSFVKLFMANGSEWASSFFLDGCFFSSSSVQISQLPAETRMALNTEQGGRETDGGAKGKREGKKRHISFSLILFAIFPLSALRRVIFPLFFL